jgi:ATPase subunit of ABC transporter with duplicated ATPase domains
MNDQDYNKKVYEKFVQEQRAKGIWTERENHFEELQKQLADAMSGKAKTIQTLQEAKDKRNSYKLSEEQEKRKAHYLEYVKTTDKPKLTQPVFIKKSFQDAKKEISKILIAKLERIDKELILSDKDKDIYRNLTNYFIKDENSPYSVKKGVCLFGDVGTGKSLTMQVFSEFTQDNTNKFKVHDMKEIARAVQQHGVEVLSEYTRGSCCYDDVGFEDKANHYGNKICIFTELVNILYERFLKNGKVFHITTNLGFSQNFGFGTFAERYDRRVVDRLREMLNIIELNGESKRQ